MDMPFKGCLVQKGISIMYVPNFPIVDLNKSAFGELLDFKVQPFPCMVCCWQANLGEIGHQRGQIMSNLSRKICAPLN